MMVKRAACAEEIVQFASMWNMDGIVVIGFCEQDYDLLRRRMRIPFAVYDGICRSPRRFLNLTIDNFDGGYQVGQHFRALGHETARGFAPGRAEQLIVPMQKADRWAFYREKLEAFRRASAVFAVSDAYAVDLMAFLAEQGISVPEDISVAGFDDTPVCEMLRPALTTVHQNGALRAKLAVDTLRELKEGRAVETEIKLPVSLVIRKSTAERKR